MKRILAFIATSGHPNRPSLTQAECHLEKISLRYKLKKSRFTEDGITLIVVHEEGWTREGDGPLTLNIGVNDESRAKKDRHLIVQIADGKISCQLDYAGTIPLFYSTRNWVSVSNIEPCVVNDSETTESDISNENLYGFVRFSHFIWDETAWKHIHSALPDSKYIFDAHDRRVTSSYLASVKATEERCNLSDKKIADELSGLNESLVLSSLKKYDDIILPLSSGYDSRMILAALSQNEAEKKRLRCFTYGPIGSVEVQAAKKMTHDLKVPWERIELPCQFLSRERVGEIFDIFGTSLHLHGMYQMEMFDEIERTRNIKKHSCLTSGFMTGVPAGQHNSLLGIKNEKTNLSLAMLSFSQSKIWDPVHPFRLDKRINQDYSQKAEERFQKAFNRFDGCLHHKSVIFDVWTRQRNFISYYPRTLEWRIPVISPHMNAEYANFFMSLSPRHLNDRLAVELMFHHRYPQLSRVVSNSNGLKSIRGKFEGAAFFSARVLNKIKMKWLIPTKYKNTSMDFDCAATRNAGANSFYPLCSKDEEIHKVLNIYADDTSIAQWAANAQKGDAAAYQRLALLQTIALSLHRLSEWNKK